MASLRQHNKAINILYSDEDRRGHVVGINLLIQNGKSMTDSSHTHKDAHIHEHRAAGSSELCFPLSCCVSVACYITVMDDDERDSMATLDFPATSPNWAATSAACHLNRAQM